MTVTPITVHKVKSWTYLFQQIKSGAKKADMRDMNDRPYKVGDHMVLNEFDQTNGTYTGDKIEVKITHIIDENTPCAFSSAALKRGFGILSIEIVDRKPA